VSVYDVNTCERTALLKGHSESVKSITQIPNNPFVISSGSRDGSILIFDLRCNKQLIESIDNLPNNTEQTVQIRPINTLNTAHFVENPSNPKHTGKGASSVLKSKSSTLNPPSSPSTHHHHHTPSSAPKKSIPVSCVLFQNEHLLSSAGATDGLIKVWDIRKLSLSSSKKQIEPLPIHTLDHLNHQIKLSTATPSTKNTKGYSNLLFNSSRSRLYANCMNNNMYEFNFVTYNSNHTRSINPSVASRDGKTPAAMCHLNTSNFIKSSISKCDNFVLTGSSDFNAYIYSTNINNNSYHFRKYMPVIGTYKILKSIFFYSIEFAITYFIFKYN
jgi:denticleless